jgi:hypothetical protein
MEVLGNVVDRRAKGGMGWFAVMDGWRKGNGKDARLRNQLFADVS